MRIFLSWSGNQSRAIAEALRDWLPYVLPVSQPWMSSTDIDRGARWSVEISEQLDSANIGIICLTPNNLEAPWVLFEAGALSKTLTRSLVCTYLFQLQPADVKGPLSQFQATLANKEETYKLLTTMNRVLGSDALSTERLNKMFDKWWPDLESKLTELKDTISPSAGPQRSDRDILEELLSLQRKNDLKIVASEITSAVIDNLKQIMSGIESSEEFVLVKEHPVKSIAPDNTIIVDTRPLLGVRGAIVAMEYPLFGTVSDFLDTIYSSFLHKVVPSSSFGSKWALKDTKTQKKYMDMGRTWARLKLKSESDDRSLDDVGIYPGMRLEAYPISASSIRTKENK